MRVIIFILSCLVWGVMDSEAGYRHRAKRGVGSYYGGFGGNDHFFNYNAFVPRFISIDPFQIQQQITANILAQQAAQQAAHRRAFISTASLGDSTVTADASDFPNDYEYIDELFNINRPSFSSSKKNKGNRYTPNLSTAAASVDPEGGYQTVFISPENPETPNIINRFTSTNPFGYKGVSVSSYTTSSDINGKKSGYRKAHATINDNGSVTTYEIES